MSKGKRVPLATAIDLAAEIEKLLIPISMKVMTVGSVRRKKEQVGDIEIAALAGEITMSDLFGKVLSVERTTIDEVVDNLWARSDTRWIADGPNKGHKHKKILHPETNVKCDIYVVMDVRAWGSSVVVRTGPYQFSRHVMTVAQSRGWHFSDGFLLHQHMKRRRPCRFGPNCKDIIPLEHEADVFEVLKIPVLTPEEREAEYGSGL
jgi:DNA polymerase/3'-5' exonuclease PolX